MSINKGTNNIKERFLTIIWALKLALKIDAKLLIIWGTLSTALSILPAVALHFNRQSVSVLSNFISTGNGDFIDVLPFVLTLGIVLTIVGISKRITGDFLYFIMYDSYYFGLEEHYMNLISNLEIKTIMDKKYRDDYSAVLYRCGSLTDFISSGCLFISKLIGAISILVVIFQVSTNVFFFSLVYLVLILALNIFSFDKVRWDARKYSDASRISNYYQSSVMTPGVAKELRIYDLGKDMLEKWETSYKEVEKFDKTFVKLRQKISFISSFTFFVFVSVVMGYSIIKVSDGTMTVDIFLMLYIMGQSISEISQVISSSLQETDRGLFFLNILRKMENSIPKEQKDWQEGFESSDDEVVFKAENISFSYDDEKNVLHNINFSITKGETIALVGLNGSGKSTLVKLLLGLFSPNSGKLSFHGKEYDSKTKGAVMRRVGMFFQDFFIFHASLRENIGFGDLKNLGNDQKVTEALKKGGADKLVKRFPKGLEQWLLKNILKDGVMLSGGEKQRVAVSRAHMSDKDVLIFDEPAAALDPIAEMTQFYTIKEKIAERTAILISHRVGFARLADRIFVLDKGRLAEIGTHDDLIDKNGIYAKLFNEQAQWYDVKEGEMNE